MTISQTLGNTCARHSATNQYTASTTLAHVLRLERVCGCSVMLCFTSSWLRVRGRDSQNGDGVCLGLQRSVDCSHMQSHAPPGLLHVQAQRIEFASKLRQVSPLRIHKHDLRPEANSKTSGLSSTHGPSHASASSRHRHTQKDRETGTGKGTETHGQASRERQAHACMHSRAQAFTRPRKDTNTPHPSWCPSLPPSFCLSV